MYLDEFLSYLACEQLEWPNGIPRCTRGLPQTVIKQKLFARMICHGTVVSRKVDASEWWHVIPSLILLSTLFNFICLSKKTNFLLKKLDIIFQTDGSVYRERRKGNKRWDVCCQIIRNVKNCKNCEFDKEPIFVVV